MNTPHSNSTTLLYKDKPLFGMDIGHSSLKIMQVAPTRAKQHIVNGYGIIDFEPSAIVDGVIQDPAIIAKAVQELFGKHVIGEITTRRVALVIPASRSFNRNVQLPRTDKKELDAAIRTEAEQYIPVPIENLYLDYEVIKQTHDQVDILLTAVPRAIIDSYMTLAAILGLEVVAIETTIGASSRIFTQSRSNDIPTILIDYGSLSSDISIFDKTLVVTGTAPGGGDSFTNLIRDTLGITAKEAHVIKTKYGLGVSKKQQQILEGMSPILQTLLREIRRMIRYYEERQQADRKIGQVICMGGGANMPGLNEWMTDHLRLPVRMYDPGEQLSFGDLQPPNLIDRPLYATVAGLALINPQDIF